MTRVMGWIACVGAVMLLVVAMVSGVSGAAADAATTRSNSRTDRARIDGAWVRLAAVPGRPGAGYFTLHAGTVPVELVAVSSPLARVELHSSSMAGGVMRMDRLPSVRVAAGGTAAFAPGGSHLMLFDVAASVRPGATVPLTLTFADGRTVRVDAAVQAAGAAAPMAMPMDHGAH